MIPDKVFDSFLASFSLTRPPEAQNVDRFEAVPASIATDGSKRFAVPGMDIWYRSNCGITLDSFRKRVKEELARSGHGRSDSVVGAILALFALHPLHTHQPTSTLNRILAHITNAELTQLFILAFEPFTGFKEFRLGPFSIGALKAKAVRNPSREAGSNYFLLYKDQIVGKMSLGRDTYSVKAIDWTALSDDYDRTKKGTAFQKNWNSGIDGYFHALAAEHFDEFWAVLMDVQHLLISCGCPYLDARHLRTSLMATPISIFSNIGNGWGHVAPGLLGQVVVDFASIDRRVPEMIDRLQRDYGLQAAGGLPSPLKSFVLFVSKGKRYSDDGLKDEAFLHYVIALDLLFGERDRSTASVTERVATITFSARRMPLYQSERAIEKVYNARSRYVHDGEEVPTELLGDVQRICEEVLWTALRRLSRSQDENDGFGNWLKQLDYIHSALIAGKADLSADMDACGIRYHGD